MLCVAHHNPETSMRALLRPVLVAAAAVVTVSSAGAQEHRRHSVSFPSRFSIAGDFIVSKPKGEFANYVGTGFGGNVIGLFRLDPDGMFSLRADLGGLQYDRETKRVAFLPYTPRVQLDVETVNTVYWGAIGPQFMFTTKGPVRPYANAAIGFMDFVTTTSLKGTEYDEEFASTENKSDVTTAYVFGGGVYIPLGRARTSASLNLGARYHFGGRASYLRKGDIIDNPDGTITVNAVSSKTDVILWQLGINVPIPARR